MIHRHLVAMTLLAGALLATRPAHATTSIQLSSMNSILLPDDCDIINVTIVPNGSIPNTRLITLSSGPMVDSWKGVDVPQVGMPAHQLYTENQHRFSSSYMPAQQSVLTFEKAKFLGAHTPEYTVDVSSVPLGSEIDFTWTQDSCPSFGGGFVVGASHVPQVVAPGQLFTVKLTLQNLGETPWVPGQRMQISDTQGIWSVAPIGLASDVTLFQQTAFTFTARAPITPGVQWFTFRFGQLGGDTISTFHVQVGVGTSAPPPPPPPAMTIVPNVVGMTGAAATTALQNAKLQPGFVFDWDPGCLGCTKIVVTQAILPGTSVPVGKGIDLAESDAMAPQGMGYSEIDVINCRKATVQLWKLDGDGYKLVADVPSGFADNGSCTAPTNPVSDQLTTGVPNHYYIVDPTISGCSGADPSNLFCVPDEWYMLGDAKGDALHVTAM